MRIGMMCDAYKPHISGVTIYIDSYRAALEEEGHEVYVFTLGNRREPGDDDHVVRSPGLPLPQRGYFVTLGYTKAARGLLESMDVVHVHHPFTSGQIALRYCKPRGTPLVFTNHTRYDLYGRFYAPAVPSILIRSLLRWYMPRFCAAVDLVISPSKSMVSILRTFGVRSPVEVVPNGVDMRRIYKAQPARRADLGLHDDDVVLVFTGRLAAEKNLRFLMRAFAQAASGSAQAHLVLVGEGRERRPLNSLALQTRVSDRVHFLGQVSYERIPALLKACDVFVTASVSEVHPLSIIEAMGAGLPSVGIHSPGLDDSVEDGVTGLLCSPDPSDFAERLRRLIQDGDLRERMGASAHRASAVYDIRQTSQVILGHYRRLAEGSRSARGLQ